MYCKIIIKKLKAKNSKIKYNYTMENWVAVIDLKAYYATFKEGSENKELTKEQQEKLGLIKLSLGREILIQNIQNECQGVASLPHIMNFDSTCVEAEKDTTK